MFNYITAVTTRTVLTIISLAFLPSLSEAQDIYGRISITGSGGSATGAEVTASCADLTAVTDDFGRYQLVVSKTGECRVQVSYDQKSSTSVTVYVSKDGTRVDLELRASEKGWNLIRK